MDTRMLAYEHAASTTEIANWANELINKEVPGSPGYRIIRIVQFQFIEKGDRYSALILVEVTDTSSENLVALKEEDVIAIEEITSSMEDAPSSHILLPEE